MMLRLYTTWSMMLVMADTGHRPNLLEQKTLVPARRCHAKTGSRVQIRNKHLFIIANERNEIADKQAK